MAKITLGKKPKNFKKTISVQMLDGTTGSIEVTYKYRTRKEFGAFIDGITAAARAAGKISEEPTDEKPFSLEELMEKTAGANADYVLDVVDGWNLEVELGKDTVEQLADEYPAAVNAIMETYRIAVTEGRLGN